ncbi:MAG: hypothetical protein LBJ57_00325, partial [Prevotellaceae bacterium]|nr:hypothetical protein [Prevotellaceae bacterium]
AAGNALLGIFVMLFSQFALIFVGIALALDSVGAVLKALRRKKNEEKGWFVEVILGITFFALGVVVVVFHNAISQLFGSALGLLLLIAGLSLVIIALLTRNSQKGAAHAAASASLQDAYTDNHK